MSRHEDIVEDAIRSAIERGEFDDLPGQGRPLVLGEDDANWWARRQVEQMRHRDAALEAAQLITAQIDTLWALPDAEAVRARVVELNRQIEELNQELAAGEHLDPVDAERTIAMWRRMYRLRG